MALERQLENIIPLSLKRGCRVLQLDNKTLTLGANNGAIASKLRQMTAEIAIQLRELGCEVTGIQVRVQVSAPPVAEPAKAPNLSDAAKSQLTELANSLADSPLKKALERLTKLSQD